MCAGVTAPRTPKKEPCQPNHQSVTRRGFLAAMAATNATLGAFALSVNAANAAAAPAGLIGPTAPAAVPHAGERPRARHMVRENTKLDKVTSTAQDGAIRPFVIDVPDADLDDPSGYCDAAIPRATHHGMPCPPAVS
jgi:hypothetical protein